MGASSSKGPRITKHDRAVLECVCIPNTVLSYNVTDYVNTRQRLVHNGSCSFKSYLTRNTKLHGMQSRQAERRKPV